MKRFIAFITKLSRRGDVFLIRLPTSPELLEIESAFCPDFEARPAKISFWKRILAG